MKFLSTEYECNTGNSRQIHTDITSTAFQDNMEDIYTQYNSSENFISTYNYNDGHVYFQDVMGNTAQKYIFDNANNSYSNEEGLINKRVTRNLRKNTNSDQRRHANIRERRRMLNLNDAFNRLRKCLPTFSYEKKLSRIETLRLASLYIGFLTQFLNEQKANRKK